MIKYLLPLSVLFVIGCEPDIINPIPTYQFSIDSVLTETGMKALDMDSNGYYLLDLQPTSEYKQTVRRITGRVLKDSLEPTPPEVIEWESSHIWLTGNDTGYYIRRVINYLGQWVNVDTNYINVPSGLIVPTINPTSISGRDGEINTMIAPIYSMRGDTMIVTGKLWTPYDKVYYDTLKIILR